jgi:DNA-binding NarL/FixJ family response regulator
MQRAGQLPQSPAMEKKRDSSETLPPLQTARRRGAGLENENAETTGTNHSKQRYAGTKSHVMTQYSVLFISADSAPAEKLERLLRDDEGLAVECTRVESLFDGLRAIQDRAFDLVLSELFLPDGQGLATLRHLQQHAPRTPVILLCHAQDRDTAVTAVRKGAHDFFCYEELDPANFQRSIQNALSSNGGPSPVNKDAERRTNARFDCHLAVSYQTLEKPFISGQGESETLNISSKGVLFRASEALEPGQLVQVSVDWPARLENQIPLKLVAEGRIVRNVKGVAAMTIEKYEFRTRRVPAQAAGQGKAAASSDGKPSSRSSEAAAEESSRPGTAAGGSTKGVQN